MSIPNNPRQLMINLMYIVLTAMLALNISAEIINAFFIVDKGISKSNLVIENSNAGLGNKEQRPYIREALSLNLLGLQDLTGLVSLGQGNPF